MIDSKSEVNIMGMFFQNLHIKKNNSFCSEQLREFLISEMKKNGYQQLENSENAEIRLVIYTPENSNWISVACDCYQFNNDEDTKKIIAPVSDKFRTDVLAVSCNDSDYLFMNLINTADGTDGWVNIGSFEGMKSPRRTSVAPWKKKVTDYEKFKSIVKSDYVFAEEAFYESAEMLGINVRQCSLETDYTEGLDENSLVKLYFSLPEGTKKQLPKLQVGLYDLSPCIIGQSKCVFVRNKGGRSKGVAIMFTGDYIENDELTFENVTFESDYGSEKRKIISIEPVKKKLENGETVLYWEDKNFNIAQAVNPSLPINQQIKLEHKKEFGVRFKVYGNPEKTFDVKVHIIPLENPQKGAACWYVKCSDTLKKIFIRKSNENK